MLKAPEHHSTTPFPSLFLSLFLSLSLYISAKLQGHGGLTDSKNTDCPVMGDRTSQVTKGPPQVDCSASAMSLD
jgi:hypothetical protein